jgi:hypothetical protein
VTPSPRTSPTLCNLTISARPRRPPRRSGAVSRASSSWSHAFATDKTWRLQPDVTADRELYSALVDGDYDTWRQRPLSGLEDSGQQELLNWHTLLGAMEALNRRRPDWCTFEESYVFNSSKAFAVYKP